jgi:hypothetical protein
LVKMACRDSIKARSRVEVELLGKLDEEVQQSYNHT